VLVAPHAKNPTRTVAAYAVSWIIITELLTFSWFEEAESSVFSGWGTGVFTRSDSATIYLDRWPGPSRNLPASKHVRLTVARPRNLVTRQELGSLAETALFGIENSPRAITACPLGCLPQGTGPLTSGGSAQGINAAARLVLLSRACRSRPSLRPVAQSLNLLCHDFAEGHQFGQLNGDIQVRRLFASIEGIV